VLAFESGDVPAALADLTAALEVSDDPTVRFNRATAHVSCHRWVEAVDDLTQILSSTEDAEALLLRGNCLLELGDRTAAEQGLLRCVVLDPDRFDEVVGLMPELSRALWQHTVPLIRVRPASPGRSGPRSRRPPPRRAAGSPSPAGARAPRPRRG
jgi:hypothetical protein